MTDQSVEIRVQGAIAELRPYFQQDSGDIEFVKLVDGVVYIRLHGCCVGCSHGMCMLYQSILEHIREQVPEVTSVENMPADNA
jgi:Fe-S cluster biogenesis protein NfuA